MRCRIDVAVDLSRTAFAPNCSCDHQQSFPDTAEALPECWSTLVRHHLLRCITYRDRAESTKRLHATCEKWILGIGLSLGFLWIRRLRPQPRGEMVGLNLSSSVNYHKPRSKLKCVNPLNETCLNSPLQLHMPKTLDAFEDARE